MKIKTIIEYFEKTAPLCLAESWDNTGLLCGDWEKDVKKILLALDVTTDVVREAKKKGAGLIIAHHPVIFDPLRRIEPGSAVALLIQYDIAALCLHTNLDRAENGVNTALANALKLLDRELFPEDFICVGSLSSPMSAEAFALYIKEKLQAPSVRFSDHKDPIRRVAVSSGGGGEGVELYEKYRFDAFVTGELKHHQYIYAAEHGVCAFDAGHFPSENVVIAPLAKSLCDAFPETGFIVSEACVCPYRAV